MKTKGFLSSVLALVIVFSLFGVVHGEGITVLINGEKAVFDTEPILQNDRLLVPMRVIFEKLGADVSWDDSTKTAVASIEKNTVKITVGDSVLYKNGEKTVLDVPAMVKDSRTLVPIRAVSEGLGADVDWQAETSIVKINSQNFDSEKKFYYIGEADAADLKKFADDKSARENFENIDLPDEVSKYGKDFAEDIKNNPSNAIKYIEDVWNHCQAEALLRIMDSSDSIYQTGDGLDEKLRDMINDNGKGADSQFEITTEDDCLVISFVEYGEDNAKFIVLKSVGSSVRLIYACEDNQKTSIYEFKSNEKEKIYEYAEKLTKDDLKKVIENMN